MSRPLYEMPAEKTEALAKATIGFLVATHEFYIACSSMKPLNNELKIPGHTWLLESTMYISQLQVNRCLETLGGLAVDFNDDETGRPQRVHVAEWRGYDDEDPELMTWGMRGMPRQASISLRPETVERGWTLSE